MTSAMVERQHLCYLHSDRCQVSSLQHFDLSNTTIEIASVPQTPEVFPLCGPRVSELKTPKQQLFADP